MPRVAVKGKGRALECADEAYGHRCPGRIGDNALPSAGARRQNMELPAVAADQASEQEAARWPRDEYVAVEGTSEVVRIEPIAPNFIAGAIIAYACGNGHCHLAPSRSRRNHQRLLPRCRGTIGTEHCDNRQLATLRMIDEVGRVDSERRGNAIEPPHGYGTGPGLQPPDGLRGRRRNAGLGHVVQRHSAGAANFPDAGNHDRVSRLTNRYGFLLSYKFASVARKKRLVMLGGKMKTVPVNATRLLMEKPLPGDRSPIGHNRKHAR